MHLVIAVGLSPVVNEILGHVTDPALCSIGQEPRPQGSWSWRCDGCSLLRLGSRQPVCRRQHAPTNLKMAMQDEKDDTVYCNIRMPVAQGRQLLQIVNALRESQVLPSLDRVFQDMQSELSMSIENVDNPSSWGPWCQ